MWWETRGANQLHCTRKYLVWINSKYTEDQLQTELIIQQSLISSTRAHGNQHANTQILLLNFSISRCEKFHTILRHCDLHAHCLCSLANDEIILSHYNTRSDSVRCNSLLRFPCNGESTHTFPNQPVRLLWQNQTQSFPTTHKCIQKK
jgi:hypothetical protein